MDQSITQQADSIGLQRQSVLIGDGAVSYLERSGSGPVLVFLHANGFNALTYRQIFGLLSKDIHLIAPDLRGHGQSSLRAVPEELSGWTQYRDDMIAFLDRLPVTSERPLIMAGHSMGGATSTMVAHRCPGRVKHLVLLDPVVLPTPSLWVRLFVLPFSKRKNFLAEGAKRRRVEFPDRDAIFKSYQGRGAFVGWPDNMLRDYIEGGTLDDGKGGVKLACNPFWEAANFSMSFNDVWHDFGAVDCPVLLFHGTELVATCPPERADYLQKQNTKIDRIQMDGHGHFFPMREPQRMADALNKVVARYA